MEQFDFTHYLGILVITLAAAKLFGGLAQRLGQPAVLGELIAGLVLGVSCLNIFSAHDHVLEFMSEMGVVILLFEIGLETDLKQLLKVGGSSFTVAIVGVFLPFLFGYMVCQHLATSRLYPSLQERH